MCTKKVFNLKVPTCYLLLTNYDLLSFVYVRLKFLYNGLRIISKFYVGSYSKLNKSSGGNCTVGRPFRYFCHVVIIGALYIGGHWCKCYSREYFSHSSSSLQTSTVRVFELGHGHCHPGPPKSIID